MSYCKILLTNYWSATATTVTPLTESAALPGSNTRSPQRTKPWRSDSSATGQTLLADLGSSLQCDIVAVADLVRQNDEAVELYEGGTGGSPGAYNLVATLPAQDPDTRISSAVFTPTSARHWKLEWTNTGAAAVAEAGYVGLGKTLAIAKTCEPEIHFSRTDPSVEQMSVDGQKSFTSRTGYYRGKIDFVFSLAADAALFHSLWRGVRREIPFFFILDSSVGNEQWLMRMGDLDVMRRGHGTVPAYDFGFEWEEAR